MEHPLKFLADVWRERSRQDRPSVTLSFAQSLDGSLTARRGAPLRLSSPQSMELTHRLRGAHDAILVGIGTVLADDPRLTVRLAEGKDPQPVVLDSQLRFPQNCNLSSHPLPPWIATTEKAPKERQAALEAGGAQVWRLPSSPQGRVDLRTLLAHLASRGIETLMVEGGAGVITSFLAERLVNQVVITIAPILVGGLHPVESLLLPPSRPYQASPNIAELFPRVENAQVEKAGDDLVIWGRLSEEVK
jgi:3,4-dihydroxy 2-butanone 4-phosphate synthase/GTP cyclohydrolase II